MSGKCAGQEVQNLSSGGVIDAAGTALFVTVMTIISAGLRDGGATDAEALAGGMRSAFLIGAIASLGLIAIAIILKRPASTEEMARELQH